MKPALGIVVSLLASFLWGSRFDSHIFCVTSYRILRTRNRVRSRFR
jgi:hypothetical protein